MIDEKCFYYVVQWFQFLPFIKDIGATGILLEWEDTFPYTKDLIQIGGLSNSAQACGAPYSIEEAKQLLEMGKKFWYLSCDGKYKPYINEEHAKVIDHLKSYYT